MLMGRSNVVGEKIRGERMGKKKTLEYLYLKRKNE
jgi:hypothetical protein